MRRNTERWFSHFLQTCVCLAVQFLFWHSAGILVHAQQNGNLPFVYQSTIQPSLGNCGGAGTLCWFKQVRSGDLVVCAGNWDTQGTLNSITFSDSASILSFTMQPAVAGANGAGQSSGNISQASELGWAIASGTAATNILLPAYPRNSQTACLEIAPANGGGFTFDHHAEGTGCSGTCPPTGVGQTSLNITAAQNDVVICTLALPTGNIQAFSGSAQSGISRQFGATIGNNAYSMVMNFDIAGAAGTQTCTFNTSSAGGSNINNYFMPLAIDFSQSSLQIGTSQMPDGAINIPYKANLTAVGGSGAFTWSVSAGSCGGLSVTDATNGVYSGTPNAAGSCTVTFQVTDGTHTTTKQLTWNIGTIMQSIQAPNCKGYGTVPSSVSLTGVQAGDQIIVAALEVDTHGEDGEIDPANAMTDNFGNVYVIATPIVGGAQGGLIIYTTKSISSGTLTLNQSLPGGSNPTPLAGAVCNIRGSQGVIDTMVINNSQPTSGTASLSSSITTQVPGQVVLCVAALGSSGTESLQSPCSVVINSNQTFANLGLGTINAATAGSYTGNVNYTDGGNFTNVQNTPLFALIPLRPAPFTIGPFTGDKRRRVGY